jgi:hypothetical protein
MIDLKKLVLEKKTVTIDYPELSDFALDLCYLGPEALKKLRDVSTVTKIDKKTRGVIHEIDDEKFAKEFCKATVRGWKGLKAKYLTELMLVDVSDLDPEIEIDFSEENAHALFTTSAEFARWINEVVFDLSNFRDRTD